ncbi:hypothetical protein CYK37_09670 [Mesorhizobium loti]|nr:hypothetical protein CYK37_09670 [Mesorhizobium loti]
MLLFHQSTYFYVNVKLCHADFAKSSNGRLGLFPKRLLDRTRPERVAGDDLKLDILMVRSPHLGPMAKVADGLASEMRAFIAVG